MSRQQNHSIKEHLNIFGPALLLILVGFVLAYQFVKPAPPSQIQIATGQNEGAYYLFAQRYKALLKQEKIQLKIVNTAGSVENIGLLENQKVDIAFVQGGTASAAQSDDLLSLGSLYFEPIWVFHRKQLVLSNLTDLLNKKIAIGPEGSGTRALAIQLLQDNEINSTNSNLLDLSGRDAADALLAQRVDAAFFVASPKSPIVRALLDAENIKLMSFSRADAYTRQHRYLSSVVLPEGVINLRRNIPPKETVLLAASANLVIHKDIHPALTDLLLQAAQEVHGNGGWFEEAGQFPTPNYLDFPLSKEARRFYDYGPPFLQRYLPFWAATLVDRLKVMLLPLLALMIPLIKIMPPIYRWRIRSRIYRWYREIVAVDHQPQGTEVAAKASLKELERIENEVTRVTVPLSYTDELYELRTHIALVRKKIHGKE